MSALLNPIPYHLLAYGTFLGSQLYQSFINTKICYRSLAPQPFHNLNKRLWPVYFRCQLGLALLTLATKPGGWLPPASLSNVLLGVACTMAGLNWYSYGPRTSDAMVERANVLKEINAENAAGSTSSKEDNESITKKVKKAFSRNHAMSIHFNLIAMIATVCYGFALGGRLELKGDLVMTFIGRPAKHKNAEYPPRLSLAEKVKLYSTATRIASTTCITHGIGGVFRGEKGALSLRVHLAHAMIRRLSDTLSDREYQYLLKPTDEAYDGWCRANGHLPDRVDLVQHGGKGLWIGDKSAKHVMVYYHGGGFALSANEVYFDFCVDLIKSLRKAGFDLAIFFVAYTLTPHARYPTQLKQCVEALDYILTKTSHAPGNVYLGGDSAGANAAISVLLHISHHPHPSLLDQDEPNNNQNNEPPSKKINTRSLVETDSYLGGIVCLSPWVDFDFDRPSERANRGRDCISAKSELAWANSYTGYNIPFDPWSEPAQAPAEWWKGVRVREFLVLAGSDEILLSGIAEFVDKVQSNFANLRFFVGENEGHVCPIVDRTIFTKKELDRIQTWRELLRWFTACLSSGESLEEDT
ncbi:Steryl acetyl hydrolase 1 [Talaromyces islandicus]|uniref:Steryl acetyl hydrolase 1 n=1 Tax=Talaromyces islandicus TaxID=28573 RepID=A0A0U1LL76_TALIS|nr:Steryl acetyl hydrolase 1 [Talaromyces islandicus]